MRRASCGTLCVLKLGVAKLPPTGVLEHGIEARFSKWKVPPTGGQARRNKLLVSLGPLVIAAPLAGSLLAPSGITRSHADARLRSDARGRDGGVRQELAAGVNRQEEPIRASVILARRCACAASTCFRRTPPAISAWQPTSP